MQPDDPKYEIKVAKLRLPFEAAERMSEREIVGVPYGRDVYR